MEEIITLNGKRFFVLKRLTQDTLVMQLIPMTVFYFVISLFILLLGTLLGWYRLPSSYHGVITVQDPFSWLLIIAGILALPMGVLIFHEIVHYLLCVGWYRVPASFGWGFLGKMMPYLSVIPHHPLKRNQWLVIALGPTIVVNGMLLGGMILVRNDAMMLFYLGIIFVLHFTGCAGDAVLMYHALQYPTSVYIKDEGPVTVILSTDHVEPRFSFKHADEFFFISKIFREIFYFVQFFLVSLFLIVVIEFVIIVGALAIMIITSTPEFQLDFLLAGINITRKSGIQLSMDLFASSLSALVLAALLMLLRGLRARTSS